jgi:hypothetical protein
METYSKGTSTPGRATADLRKVRKDGEGVLVAQRNVVQAVVGKGAEGSNGSSLLTSSHGSGGDEHTGELAAEGTGLPQASGAVNEGLLFKLLVCFHLPL